MGQFHFLLREDQLSRCQISATCSSSRPLSSNFFISFSFTAGFERVCQTVFHVPGLTLYKVNQALSRFGGYVKCHDDIISYLIYLVASSIILSPFQKWVLSAPLFLSYESSFVKYFFGTRLCKKIFVQLLSCYLDFLARLFSKGLCMVCVFLFDGRRVCFDLEIKLTRCILFGSIYCLTCNFFSFSVVWQW